MSPLLSVFGCGPVVRFETVDVLVRLFVLVPLSSEMERFLPILFVSLSCSCSVDNVGYSAGGCRGEGCSSFESEGIRGTIGRIEDRPELIASRLMKQVSEGDRLLGRGLSC